MSAKVRISYTDDSELQALLWLMSPMVKDYKEQPAQGRFKRAYVEIKERYEIPMRNHSKKKPEKT